MLDYPVDLVLMLNQADFCSSAFCGLVVVCVSYALARLVRAAAGWDTDE